MVGVIEPWRIPTPLPVGPVNAYRLPGPPGALIDAGPRTPEAREALLERLRASPVRILVVTHEHADHAGLARTLQRDGGVEVWAHAREASVLERWNELAAERERDYEAGLRAADVPARLQEQMRYGGRRFDTWAESVRPDRAFEGGERLGLGGGSYEVVDAPGHTPGSFLLSDGVITFSGDTLLERITPNALSVREKERGALVDYLATLRRLVGGEWGHVHPGHGSPFGHAGDVIRLALAHAERRQARILRVLQAEPRTAFGVVERLFPGLPDEQAFLAVSEVLGHLEVLAREGRLGRERADGVDTYRASPA